MTKKYLDELTYKVIGCCITVHNALGPGLLESVYHKCLLEEFKYQGIRFSSELIVPIEYRNVQLDALLRADFLVEDCLVIELKAVEAVLPIHEAQLITYLKLLDAPKGILVNFNCTNIFHNGQKTYVTEKYKYLDEK
ncbi:GxxExxY protein [Paenimyroides aestuarii]|uniref:GxxExxY protein n=1 Tax=Paenimyroides aestuarii TaxID=2968490 RepID=A0ABY5NRQ1_9FLAO|nr:GxxExxY protein [Paenimyroides aestuarii]UUV21246.1 GxxExxY protein [Paenimyroides aestuarii]